MAEDPRKEANQLDKLKEGLVLLFFCWLFIITMILRGVFIVLTRYWYVWIGLALFAVAFYHLNPNLGGKEDRPAVAFDTGEVAPFSWENYEGWTCRWTEKIAIINGHSVDAEECVRDNAVRARLFVGNEILEEVRCLGSVCRLGMTNKNLLMKLKKRPETTARSDFRESMYREDI